MKLLVVGAGRMGLSHLAVLNGLVEGELEVTVIDPSFANRLLFRLLLRNRGEFFSSLSQVNATSARLFDYALITTPPTIREQIFDTVQRYAERVFVEKPVRVAFSDRMMSGYVLQHCPMNNVVRSLIPSHGLKSISASLETNLSFGNSVKTWRGGAFGTVLYEFGGHLLTLVAACNGLELFSHAPSPAEVCSVQSMDPNYVEYSYLLDDGLKLNCSLMSNSTRVRKARYEVAFEYDGHYLVYDIYSLKKRCKSTGTEETIRNIATEGCNSSFYLRGFEFTHQMERFLSGKFDYLSTQQLKNIEEVIEHVARH